MEMTIQAILLGIIQGITEFLPISSSAHLYIFSWIFNFKEISASFDLALHIGTLVALCIYFFKDGIYMIKSGFNVLVSKLTKKEMKDEIEIKEGDLFWYIVLATIPAGLLSLLLDNISDIIENSSTNRFVIFIAVVSICMGVLLYFVDKKSKEEKDIEKASFKDVMIVGISQAFAAAFPGVSRSGITISTARFLKIDRASSAKLSFLLSIPIVLAAVLVKMKDFDLTYPIPFFAGILVSFIVGLFVIRYLMNYLKKGDYKLFAIYRICFAAYIIAVVLFRLISAS